MSINNPQYKIKFPKSYPDTRGVNTQWLCDECYQLMKQYLLLSEYTIDDTAEPDIGQKCDSCANK